MRALLPLCPACRQGFLRETTMFRSFNPNKKEVIVELLTCKCDHCGESATLAAQQVENRSRLDARKSQYGAVLMGEAYLTLRKRYPLAKSTPPKLSEARMGGGELAECPPSSRTFALRVLEVVKSLECALKFLLQ